MLYPYGQPLANALFKQQPEDFIVGESLPFELTGEGEHIYLYLQKRELNTEQVAKLLAQHAHLPYRHIGYAGLKDKQAITQQWFSLYTNKDIDFSSIENEQLKIIKQSRHQKKLKRGVIKDNSFKIRLGNISVEKTQIEERLQMIKDHGFANYFGPQRFGHDGNNLKLAQSFVDNNETIRNRSMRSRIFSSMRAHLFNHVLSTRIQENNWNHYLLGDVMNLAGSNSYFQTSTTDEPAVLEERLLAFDIHPTGPMWGVGAPMIRLTANELEQKALLDFQPWQHYLEQNELEYARRPLRAICQELSWQWQDDDLIIKMQLDSGCYASVVLMHCFELQQN